MQTILIVDDSPTIRRMVQASLGGSLTAAFAEAGSGLEAIETLAVKPVDAIVLDLNMPDMHGLDVLRFVRQHAQYRGVPVLVLTTRGDASSKDAAIQAGASAYMTKPFSPPALAAAVKDLLANVSTGSAR
jgi:two-component system, chemotaxis family, chemotaxis protein CheY